MPLMSRAIRLLQGPVQLLRSLTAPRSAGRPARSHHPWTRVGRVPIARAELVRVERDLVRLNRWMHGFDRPDPTGTPLQGVPGALKIRALTTLSVLDGLNEMVAAIEPRIGAWEIPWHEPRVEKTNDLEFEHPAWISVEDGQTVVRIAPGLLGDRDSIAPVLAHALAHFVIEHNAASTTLVEETTQERLADLFVIAVGYGRLFLHRAWGPQAMEQPAFARPRALGADVMAYVHARCGYQHDVPAAAILEGLDEDARDVAIEAMTFFTSTLNERLEVLVCPNDHVLVGRLDDAGARIQCRCGWRYEYWRTRPPHLALHEPAPAVAADPKTAPTPPVRHGALTP